MNSLIVIAGPTATGKSALAVEVAKRIGGSVISADSMQVYRGMDIGTAKITKEEMNDIPHYLIDVCDPSDDFNVVTYNMLAKEAIADIRKAGRIPIIAGGTGFYIQSVIYDIDFSKTDEHSGYRQKLWDLIDEKGPRYVHKLLEDVDPEAAGRIHENDSKRMIRALEYNMQTGGMISEHNRLAAQRTSPYDLCYFVLSRERKDIYERIEKRVDEMFALGLEDEVRLLLSKGLTPEHVSMQGLGYKETIAYLNGNITKEEAVRIIKRDSRHYAKRQITWFKREKDTIMLDAGSPDLISDVIDKLKEKGMING